MLLVFDEPTPKKSFPQAGGQKLGKREEENFYPPASRAKRCLGWEAAHLCAAVRRRAERH